MRLFVAVMRAGGFAAAARQQGLDPSSVSRAIGALERDLGCQLFARSTRQFQPTDAGRTYFEHVAPLLEELDVAASRARDVAAAPAGRLRIAASVAFGSEVLAPLVGDLRQRYPRLEIEFVLSDAQVDLIADQLDVAIRLGPEPTGDLNRIRLMSTRHRLCASPQWQRRHGPIGRPADIAAIDCIRFPFSGFSDRWQFRRGRGRPVGVAVSGTIVVSSAIALRRCILDGLGPGLLADWMCDEHLERGDLIELLPQYHASAAGFDRAAWLVFPRRAYIPLKVRVFSEFLQQKLR